MKAYVVVDKKGKIVKEAGIDNIPHNESDDLITGFDGTYYPMPNRTSWEGSWILPFIE